MCLCVSRGPCIGQWRGGLPLPQTSRSPRVPAFQATLLYGGWRELETWITKPRPPTVTGPRADPCCTPLLLADSACHSIPVCRPSCVPEQRGSAFADACLVMCLEIRVTIVVTMEMARSMCCDQNICIPITSPSSEMIYSVVE